DHLDLEALLVAFEDREFVAVRRQRADRRLELRRSRGVELDEPVRDGEIGGVMAVVDAQARSPAFELRERTGEPLPARLRQLGLAAGAVVYLEVAEPLAHEEVLELGLLLEVELLVAELHL